MLRHSARVIGEFRPAEPCSKVPDAWDSPPRAVDPVGGRRNSTPILPQQVRLHQRGVRLLLLDGDHSSLRFGRRFSDSRLRGGSRPGLGLLLLLGARASASSARRVVRSGPSAPASTPLTADGFRVGDRPGPPSACSGPQGPDDLPPLRERFRRNPRSLQSVRGTVVVRAATVGSTGALGLSTSLTPVRTKQKSPATRTESWQLRRARTVGGRQRERPMRRLSDLPLPGQ
jgi:hypothetical protein